MKNYKNVDLIPLQEHATFWYSNKTKWEKTREENVHQSGRLPAPNVLSKSSFETPLDGFSYFMPDTLLLFILENTNKKVQNFHDCFANNEDYFYKNKHCKLLDMVELKAFIRLLYLQASLKSTFPSWWYLKSSNGFFATTVSKKCFQFISRFFEFDVRKTREERWKHDKFACMRYIFDEVNCKFSKGWKPSPFLLIDETLYPYRGHISFKQYNPSKHTTYGLLFHSLWDASVPYSLPYAGKPDVIDDETNKYYVTGTENYTKYLLNGFCKSNKIKSCSISMDQYFT